LENPFENLSSMFRRIDIDDVRNRRQRAHIHTHPREICFENGLSVDLVV